MICRRRSWGTATPLQGRRWGYGSLRTHVLRDQIGVLPEAVACTLDLDNDGMVQQPVEQCRGDNRIAEDIAPFCEAAVRSENHGALFVAGVDELEEQVAAARGDCPKFRVRAIGLNIGFSSP